jgi:hypothetical protein
VSIARVLLLSVIALADIGCAPKSRMIAMRSGQGEAMPIIRVKPGYVERIALMDRYRLHDEERKLMMAKPRVWVEEVSEDEIPTDDGAADADGTTDSAGTVTVH